MTTVPLTSLSHGAGCGCKLAAADLLPIVRDLPHSADPRLLVGSATGDDAAIFRVSDDLALVQTIDFFTPLVDDPYDFGRIAAANALSDVYAMGGRPLTAMNVVAFPLELSRRHLAGAAATGGVLGEAMSRGGGHPGHRAIPAAGPAADPAAAARAARRSRCGMTTYFGSRADARPASKTPNRAVSEAAR